MERSLLIKQMKPSKVMDYLGINRKFLINKKQGSFLKRALTSGSSVDQNIETEGDESAN